MINRLARRHARKMIKFALVGALSTTIDWTIYLILVRSSFFNSFYVLAKVIATAVGTVNSFSWNKIWTFRNKSSSYAAQLGRQGVAAGASLGLNASLIFLLVDYLHFNKQSVVTLMISTGVVFFFNYAVNHLWIFKESPQEIPAE